MSTKHNKSEAFELRRQGNSYKSISRELGIPLATLAGWFKKESWSEEIKIQLIQQQLTSSQEHMQKIADANRKRWESLRSQYRKEAIGEFKKLKKSQLFIAGLMLYWGEGERNPKSASVRLANSDPALIKIFYIFLKNSLQISEDKIYAWLLLYPDLIDSVQKKFWSTTTGIPPEQFKKPVVMKSKDSKKRSAYGVCTVFVNSRALKERMLAWIQMADDYLKTIY